MKKIILVALACLAILIPAHNTRATVIINNPEKYICGEYYSGMVFRTDICFQECKYDCDCRTKCKDREALKSKNAAILSPFYNNVRTSNWFDFCLDTNSIVGNKISNLGFAKFSLVSSRYNYIFTELDNKISSNKSYYNNLLKTEVNINNRVALNNELKSKDDCLNLLKAAFDLMLKQKKYNCYDFSSDINKQSANASGVCEPFTYLLDIYKEAHNSLCPSSDSVEYSVKKEILDMYSKNQSFSSVGCANGYTYDQCNLSCVSNSSYASSYLSDIKNGQLIKNREFAEVFYVDDDLCLHWIINEKAAAKHFGKTWNRNIKEHDKIVGYKFCNDLK